MFLVFFETFFNCSSRLIVSCDYFTLSIWSNGTVFFKDFIRESKHDQSKINATELLFEKAIRGTVPLIEIIY